MDDKTSSGLKMLALALLFCIAVAGLVLGAMSYAKLHDGQRLDSIVQSGALSTKELDKAMEEAEKQAGLRGKSVSATDLGGLGAVLGGGKHGANRHVSIAGVRLLDSPDWEIFDHTAGEALLGQDPHQRERLQVQINQTADAKHATVMTFDLSVRLVAKKHNPGPVSVGFNASHLAVPAVLSTKKKHLTFHHAAVDQVGVRAPVRTDITLSDGDEELIGYPLGGTVFAGFNYTKVTVSAAHLGEGVEEGEEVLLRVHGTTPTYSAVGQAHAIGTPV